MDAAISSDATAESQPSLLSLNRKRSITAQCDETLTSLQEAVHSRTFKATR
jgi:hypothetical protein